ncbi:MAG: hypothetical protein V3R81_10990 [Gammaproteobacteria bacterium]
MTEINVCLTCQAPPCTGDIGPGCPLWQHRQEHQGAHIPGHFGGCGCKGCRTIRKLDDARRRFDGTPMTLAEFADFSGINVGTIRHKVADGQLKARKLPRIKPLGGPGAPVLHVVGV